MFVYLDHSAATPIDKEIAKKIYDISISSYANPSALHSAGRKSATLLKKSRRSIANSIGCTANEIIFTSGATESNNFVIKTVLETTKHKIPHIIISPLEHKSIYTTLTSLQKKYDFSLSILPTDKFGIITTQDLKKIIKKNTVLVSIAHACSEIGTIQNIAALKHTIKDTSILFHTDATQIFNSTNINIQTLNIDFLTLSSHKMRGPHGIGLLYIKKGVNIQPQIFGGGQEYGLRAGTENVAACIGFQMAIQKNNSKLLSYNKTVQKLSHMLHEGITSIIPDIKLTGHPLNRLNFHRSYVLPHIKAEKFIILLDLEGIHISSGSACNIGNNTPSLSVLALGYSNEAALRSIRFTLSDLNTEQDILFTLSKISKIQTALKNS